MATTNLGRIKGSMIYTGDANKASDIKTEITNPLNGDIYISSGYPSPWFTYDDTKLEWVDQGILGGPPGIPARDAGFGVPTATINAGVGTPGVTVTASGPDTAKIFNFQFSNLKGATGAQGVSGPQGPKGDQGVQGLKGDTGAIGAPGVAAGFGTPIASVNATVGTPSVAVTASGPDTAKIFNFQFSNLKGATGAQGIAGPTGSKGDKGDTGAIGVPGIAAGFGIPVASVNATVGTPSVAVTASGPDTAKIFNFQFSNLKGATGAQGIAGPQGPKGDQGVPGIKGDTGAAGKTPVVTASMNAKGELILNIV